MERFTGERRNAIKRDLFAPEGLFNQGFGMQGVGFGRRSGFAAVERNRGFAVTLRSRFVLFSIEARLLHKQSKDFTT